MLNQDEMLEQIIKATLARISQTYSIRDIRSAEPIRDLGLDEHDLAQFEVDLYRTVSGSQGHSFRVFADSLHITPSSTVHSVEQRLHGALTPTLAQAAYRSLAAPLFTVPMLQAPLLDVAFRTAVARKSRHHSIAEIQGNQTLAQLGLSEPDVQDVKTDVYKMWVSRPETQTFAHYQQSARLSTSSLIGGAFQEIVAAILPGDNDTKIPG